MKKNINIEFIKLLGKGKSGYSYLIKKNNQLMVYKKIHYEPCAYYTFHGNKTLIELNAYNQLIKMDIKIPMLYEADCEENIIIKEYIEGKTLAYLIAEKKLTSNDWTQIFKISSHCKKNHYNLDYFPCNFIKKNNTIYYIDYEINSYEPQWDFIHWGIYYWINSEGMKTFLKTNDFHAINLNDLGIPIQQPFLKIKKNLLEKYL